MLTCLLTNSTAYAKKERLKAPKGIIIHSTGKNDPYLKNYFQPTQVDRNIKEILKELGDSNSEIDYNHSTRPHNFHFWIGKNQKGNTITVETIPISYKVWNDNYIHICICEDGKNNEVYAKECYEECKNICKLLNNTNILDHSEVSNMPDVNYWFKKFNLSIAKMREEIKFDF